MDFSPTYVLVVTWLNLAEDVDSCRWYTTLNLLYSNEWWYERYYGYVDERAAACLEDAKRRNVSQNVVTCRLD